MNQIILIFNKTYLRYTKKLKLESSLSFFYD